MMDPTPLLGNTYLFEIRLGIGTHKEDFLQGCGWVVAIIMNVWVSFNFHSHKIANGTGSLIFSWCSYYID